MVLKIPEPPAPPQEYRAQLKTQSNGTLKVKKPLIKKTKLIRKSPIIKKTVKKRPSGLFLKNKITKPIKKKTSKKLFSNHEESNKTYLECKERISKLEKNIETLKTSLSKTQKINSKLDDVRSLFNRIREVERLSAEYEKDEKNINLKLFEFNKKLNSQLQKENNDEKVSIELEKIYDLNIEFDNKLKRMDKELVSFFKSLAINNKKMFELENKQHDISGLKKEINSLKKNTEQIADIKNAIQRINTNIIELAEKLNTLEEVTEKTIVIE